MRRFLLLPGLAPALVLGFAGTAFADDNDVAVVGPTRHSSIAVFDDARGMHSDPILHSNGTSEGKVEQHDNYLTLQGIYAITPSWSVFAELPYTFFRNDTQVVGKQVKVDDTDGFGEAVGVSGWLHGAPRAPGFSVAVTAGQSRVVGETSIYYVQFQPQWRSSPQVRWGATLGESDVPSYGNTPYGGLNLEWQVDRQFSLLPRLMFYHFGGANGFSPFNEIRPVLSATYHLNPAWALSGQVQYRHQEYRESGSRPFDLENGRGYDVQVGVRRTF